MPSNKVVALEGRQPKNWTATEHVLLQRALKVLAMRGESHYPEYFEDDQGNACVAFTVGYHVDATLSISKVGGRYVVLRYDGSCAADSPSLLSALAKAFYGGVQRDDVRKRAFLYGVEALERWFNEEESTVGSLQA